MSKARPSRKRKDEHISGDGCEADAFVNMGAKLLYFPHIFPKTPHNNIQNNSLAFYEWEGRTATIWKEGIYMNFDKIVCNCMNVTTGMIKEAVDAGAATVEEVQNATGAGTVCGACLEDVERLVDFFVAEQDSNSNEIL